MEWFRFLLSTVFVLSMLAALLWWLKRRQTLGGLHPQGRRIQLLETQPLGLKHKMMLVQVDTQMVLVAMNGQDIRTLHAWPATSNGPDGLPTPAQCQVPQDSPTIFSPEGHST